VKGYLLLREYLRTCRRVRNRPDEEGRKKIAHLRFLGAHLCPDCGEEIDPESYRCTKDAEGAILESYRCLNCGNDYTFPRDRVH